MQQVLISIENRELEIKLLDEANKRGRQLENIIMEALEKSFLQKKENRKLRYRKLNPLKHMVDINYDIDENDCLENVSPFKDVTDSVAYVKELRQNAWRR